MSFSRFLPIIFSLIWLPSATAQEIKCATIDAKQLLAQYHVAEAEISLLLVKKDKYNEEELLRNNELNEVEAKLTVLIAKLREKNLSPNERHSLREDYNSFTAQYTLLSKGLQGSELDKINELERQIAVTTRRLLDEIQTAVQKYAKDNKYHWVIDTSGLTNSQISPLVYARDTTDVTDAVLTILNKDKPKK